MITLGTRSLQRLEGVHPDLVRAIKRAAMLATPEQDFLVVQGTRTREQCMENYGKGRTAAQCVAKGVPASYALPSASKVTWLNNPFSSNHVVKADGFGHAVDLGPAPYVQNETYERLLAMSKLIKSAALQEKVAIIWGGDWQSSKDFAHFELAG